MVSVLNLGLFANCLLAAVTTQPSISPDGQPANLNVPIRAKLAEVCDRAIEGYLKGAVGNAYRLTPDQKAMIRARFAARREEQIAQTINSLPRRKAIMNQYNERVRSGAELTQAREEARAAYQELNNKDFIFRQDAFLKEMEPMLPPKQVAGARERLAALQKQGCGHIGPLSGDAKSPNRRQGPSESGTQLMMQRDPWHVYGQSFIDVLKLDQSQQAVVRSLVRESVQRRADLRAAHPRMSAMLEKGDLEGAGGLVEQIDAVFNDMRMKLDRIPTAAQWEQAKISSAGRSSGVPVARPTDLIGASIPAPVVRP